MLVTDGGQLIRSPVHDIRIASRRTQGVTLFKVSEDERVVSVARLPDVGEDDDGNGAPDDDGENGDDGDDVDDGELNPPDPGEDDG